MQQLWSPYIRVALDDILPPGHIFPERQIWDYEFLYVKQGTLTIEIEDIAYTGKSGDLFVLKPQKRHRIIVVGSEAVRQPHVHFDLVEKPDSPHVPVSFRTADQMNAHELAWFRPDELSGPETQLPNLISLSAPSQFEQLLFAIIDEFRIKSAYSALRMKGLLLELVAYALRETERQQFTLSSKRLELLDNVKHYLQKQLFRPVTLDELSAHFHLNKRYLIGLFRQAFGQTPIQYHQQLRMEQAKTMLKFTMQSIQEIADTLGYPSIHMFSRAFKNSVGCSPSSYRANFHSL
ncbi:helix-turn-helix domain-containing protein [Paenibacillus sp. GCM10027626]|uniref:helix-turn-helix transcriptional regulator n=1 Tax=Paenibacillus sp. GCM10027626 TaxID=3273411 RepID=UPI00362B32D3